MSTDKLQLETRRTVFSFIEKNPGAHLRDISREMGMAMGTLRYHLDYLVKQELVMVQKERNLKIYFASGRLSGPEKEIVGLLRQKRFRDVILDVLTHPGTTQADIAIRLEVKTSTLSKYTTLLEQRGILTAERDGRKKFYEVRDEREVINLLLTYRKSFWDKLVDNVLTTYFER